MSTIELTILSVSLIFAATTIGSAFVFFFRRNFGVRLSNIILGFASGIMIAASFFGLLVPSVAQAEIDYASAPWLPPVGGFFLGGLLLYGIDKLVPHIHNGSSKPEGLSAPHMDKNFKFFLAVTIHNIPEGMSVGFACGLAFNSAGNAALAYSALALAIGIAIQNIPEGAAVSVPMFGRGIKKMPAFLWGTASGSVEPVFAVMGFFLAAYLEMLQPWLLSFGAGAMIYVTIDELLPEARKGGFEHYGLWAFMAGFALMMLLETLL